ncbi:hypothetical protein [Paludisphaera sp.]|uniref:hypothetical protein n=1 Tax=Paludisphaera sp. TaxID=2017432 RepID=UPI00301B6D0E
MGLIVRAKNWIRGLSAPEAEVQYYNVLCPMGHRVRGQRTEGYQALRCPACGEGVFVLPASALPDPGPRVASPVSRRPAGSFASSMPVEEGPIELEDAVEATVDVAGPASRPTREIEIPWEDDADAAPRPEPRRPTRPRPASDVEIPAAAHASEPVVDRRPARPARRGRPVVEIEPRPRGRSTRKPLWIFALVALVVVATISLRVWRTVRQSYPQVAELGRVEGIPALEAGDFDRAHQLLAPARQAVDALGGQVEDADRIRQAADEAALYVNLASLGLEEMLDEAARATTPGEWESRFSDRYKGRGVLFDSKIRSSPADPSGRYEIEYVVLPTDDAGSFRAGGARPDRSARVDFRGFELFDLAQPKAGDKVVFGARLAALEYDAEDRGWVVRLEPKSGLFVQFHEALAALGWPDPDSSTVPIEGIEP